MNNTRWSILFLYTLTGWCGKNNACTKKIRVDLYSLHRDISSKTNTLCAALRGPYQLRYGLDHNNKNNDKVELAWKIADFRRLTRFDAEFCLLPCKLWPFLYSYQKIDYLYLPRNKLLSFSGRHLYMRKFKRNEVFDGFLRLFTFLTLFVYVFDSW